MLNLFRQKPLTTGTGEGLKPGASHYRAYVGPPGDYDLVSAMVFNLLTCVGLRQHHRVLDIGCGSLRIGRLLIPYLNPGNYIGVEPNQWLVRDGILNEIGRDMVRLKKPEFSYRDSLDDYTKPLHINYAIAQSIFSHCSREIIRQWLCQASRHLADDGVLFATFISREADFDGRGWVYPDCVGYTPATMAKLAAEGGLGFEVIDWRHPRQTWAAFYKPGYQKPWADGQPISWNRIVDMGKP
jgi:SAM-dependent methyltransferase